ncbi:hypothetical protein H0H92_013872 [Tricholoma furcatifolium]|nr:hypothetical protein H0H92_013872 [Tricholoma furcatifolium]
MLGLDIASKAFPEDVVVLILSHLLVLFTDVGPDFDPNEHFCSLSNPCQLAWSSVLSSFRSLRLLASSWNTGVVSVLRSSSQLSDFFKRVEHAYYPHAWHINTKIRKHVLLGRFRIFKTIDSEDGDRGIYLAYDFGSNDSGCRRADVVIVKAWLNIDDRECVTERTVYDILRSTPFSGIPEIIRSAQDRKSGVYAIVQQRLGPTLDDVLQNLPERRLDGTSSRVYPELRVIDFGFSSILSTSKALPDGVKADTIGNRHFLTLSHRDDLESLAYLIAFLAHGKLPWSLPSGPPERGKPVVPLKQLWRSKMATPASVLFRNMDPSFIDFWKDIKGLAFGEMPDYDAILQRFEDCWVRNNHGGCPGDVDWSAIVNWKTDVLE